MADYNLSGLTTRDFQHMVQAIARKQIAAGVTAYGDGRDGARDLTYSGSMDYPSITQAWNGYMILGCKFRQRLADSEKNFKWASQQMTKDLNKFLNKRRALKRPNYYIFATNVELSAVAKIGGRDRLQALLDTFKLKLGLKDTAIWDYNDLRGFIDGDSHIRAAYGHLITVGDILDQVIRTVKTKRRDFQEALHSFLQKELISDMSAKLQSAGDDPEIQIPLANVFVDLPIVFKPEAVTADDESDKQAYRAVTQLLTAGAMNLRRGETDDSETIATKAYFSRFVIVGGPGQGKSTLGQYLCQVYRAAILKDRPIEKLDGRVPAIIKQLTLHSSAVGGMPSNRRFPMRIELRSFSHALMTNPKYTLLSYLTEEIKTYGGCLVDIEDLKLWLGTHPFLLVLDGLDEVPPSSNRDDVVKCVDDFRVDAASVNADILIVVTTRPQSYSEEFKVGEFFHVYLRPLRPAEALQYGKKLAVSRCNADQKRCKELIASLEKAAASDLTARLMQSPLQVTIMATLLEDTGEPPQQRYRLFAEYYRTIYKRETRRKLLSGILSERQTDIDIIHASTGFLLQAYGEVVEVNDPSEDKADSALSDEQFRNLVKNRLDHIKVPTQKASELLTSISDSSLQRLVFLVRSKEGWVRFDVTSFKEFMAAEAVMSGTDRDVRERIRAIASASYWRNVLLFAVGRCFTEREYMLDSVVSICNMMNQFQPESDLSLDVLKGSARKAVYWGSRLAIDVLLDGTAAQYPYYELQFAKVALDSVRLADRALCSRLASTCHDDLNALFEATVNEHLGQQNFWDQLGGWYLLFSLADRNILWATKLLHQKWPTDSEHQSVLLSGGAFGALRSWYIQQVSLVAPKVDPSWFLTHQTNDNYHLTKNNRWPQSWQPIASLAMGYFPRINVANRSRWSTTSPHFHISGIHFEQATISAFSKTAFLSDNWNVLVAGAKFSAAPSIETLAAQLRYLAEADAMTKFSWASSTPWPLAACVRSATDRQGLIQIAERVERGELGDTSDWLTAEARWKINGITDDDFAACNDQDWPFSASISQSGFPFAAVIPHYIGDSQLSYDPDYLRMLNEMQCIQLRDWLASLVMNSWYDFVRAGQDLPVDDYFELVSIILRSKQLSSRSFPIGPIFASNMPLPLSEDRIRLLDEVGESEVYLLGERVRPEILENVTHHFCTDPNAYRGLLKILHEAATTGCKVNLPRYALEAIRNWEIEYKQYTLSLFFTRTDLDQTEIENLACEICSLVDYPDAIWQSLRIAFQTSSSLAALLALEMLKQLKSRSSLALSSLEHIKHYLVQFLIKQPSGLIRDEVWENLRLPVKV